jgi:2-aminoadipate transaminase
MTTSLFAERISNIPESFIREILKVATQKEMISFAGGLPNPRAFPSTKLAEAADKVFRTDSRTALQYAPTEGYLPLREYIADRQSRKEGLNIAPEDILILNGSQQGLDLTGKLFLDPGTNVLLEDPSYLGAIQAFSAYQPCFKSVLLTSSGASVPHFIHATRNFKPKFFYCIPNFQNPTGYTYDAKTRIELMETQVDSSMLWIEDNPYGEISFERREHPSFHSLMPQKTVYLGSFSKIISPGLRLGWATGPKEIIKKMVIAKQASDLHSNNLAQRIVYQFLIDNPLDEHLDAIRSLYREQASRMLALMRHHFPESASWEEPRGGMFVWVTLPPGVSASDVLQRAIAENVLFVPGNSFYVDPGHGENTMRMNFSNPTPGEMENGITILGRILRDVVR